MTHSDLIRETPLTEEDLAYELAEDNKLRSIGIDPNGDPIEITMQIEQLYRKYKEDQDNAEESSEE